MTKTRKTRQTTGAVATAFAAGALAATLVLGLQACGGGDQTAVATATASAPATVVQTVPATKTTRTSDGLTQTAAEIQPPENGDIRGVDFKTVVKAQPLVRDLENVIYSDFTNDGSEDALVLVRLEGSGAYLDYYVYTIKDGEVVNLFEKLEVSHGKVALGTLPGSFVETSAVYGPDDPNCCPSNILMTTYAWAASAKVFTEVSVEMAPNPQAARP